MKIKIYQQHTSFKDKLEKTRILVSVFLLTVYHNYQFLSYSLMSCHWGKSRFQRWCEDELAIGIPSEDIGSTKNGGAVQVTYGSTNGLSATSLIADQFWTQDSANVNDAVEEGDHFGWPLG